MRGGRRKLLGGAAALLALALAAGVAAGPRARMAGDGPVPLLTVEPETFLRRVVAEGNLRAAQATPITVPQEIWGAVRIAWMVAEGEPVAAGEIVARLDPTDLERGYLDAIDQRATADLQLERAAVQAAAATRNLERDADLAGLELEHVQSFQRRDELVFSRLEIIESEVDEALALRRQEHAEAEKEVRRTLARTERELLEVERRRADLALERATTGLGLLEVTAPHRGFMIRERNWRGEPVRPGDTVWRGQKLGELPDLATMEAEVWVLEADAGGLAPGQRARVVVESRPEEPLDGVVTRVDGVARPRVPASPV
jgi:HlyD family secretion protein